MVTKTPSKSAAPVAVQAADAATVDAIVAPASKPTPAERLAYVLDLLGLTAAAPDRPVVWGKSNGILGGGSVYINKSNADVRTNSKRTADWHKDPATGTTEVRGTGSNYLRIAFPK